MAIIQYEYKLVSAPSQIHHEQLTAYLNKFGIDGWQLCGIDYGALIFMRPKVY